MLALVVWVLVGLIALLILYPVLTTVVLTIEDAFLTPDAFVLDPGIPRVLGNTLIDVV